MSPWQRGRFPEYSREKPAPTGGIKVDKPGATWWGKQWIDALERVLQGDAGRLARGRAYARAGRTHDFVVANGKVLAKVTGSRDPYQVSIELPQLPDAAWQAAIAFMAEKAEFAALLLNREMPRSIDEAFHSASASLFPKKREDLRTSCDCPDYGDPCKHIAAVHYVLGEALDRDPFLLFELRGRTRDQVLSALRTARGSAAGAEAEAASSGAPARGEEGPATVALVKLDAQSYDAAPAPLPALSFSFDPPAAHGAVLRQLGAPGSWNGAAPPLEALAPLVRTAADAARRLAFRDAAPEPEPDNTTSAPSALQSSPKPNAIKARVPKPRSKGPLSPKARKR